MLFRSDRFEFGIRIGKGLEIGAEVHAKSSKDAEKLAASVAMLQAMMIGREPAAPKFDLQVKDGTIKLSLAVTEDDLKKAIAAQRTRAQGRASSGELEIHGGNAVGHQS